MSYQIFQNRRSTFLEEIETFVIEPETIHKHREFDAFWSPHNPAKRIIGIGETEAFRRRNRYAKPKSHFFEDKPEFKVLESEKKHEQIYDFDELNFSEELEYDVYVKMPPVKERTIKIKIKSIEKAEMLVVEPE